jgi:signal transduction histidine kinase
VNGLAEPPWFGAGIALLTLIGALYPVRMSAERTFHYPVGYLAGAVLFFFGPAGMLLVGPPAALGALIPYRFVFALDGGLPVRLVRERPEERKERMLGMAVEGVAGLAVGTLVTHLVYGAIGPGTYPIPINSPRAMLTFMALLSIWGASSVTTLELVVRLRTRRAPVSAELPVQAWIARSEVTLYWIMLIVTGPLHVAHQAVYLHGGPLLALAVLIFLFHVNTVFNLSTYRRDQLRDTLRQLETNQKLAAIGEVTARIAHTTRHQLGLIGIGTLKLERLLQSLTEADAALLREELGKLDDVRTSLQEMLVEDLHPPDHRAEAEPSPGEGALGELVTRQVGLLGPKAAERGVSLRLERDDHGVPPVLMQHPMAMAEGLFGVIENAVSLARSEVVVRYVSGAAMTTIEVLDDGPGMPAEVLARATEPFFTTRPEGTGMGLAIARGTIEREGGALELGNRADGGLRVAFVLRRVRTRSR